jgi:hypothetical protein
LQDKVHFLIIGAQMNTDEAFNNIAIVMNDCYDAAERLYNNDLGWDADAYNAMGDLLKSVLEKYFHAEV